MAYYSVGEAFGVDKAILRFNRGNYFPISVTVPRTKLSANAEGKKSVPAGLFVAEETPGVYRYLPRAVVTQATVTTSNSFKTNLSYLFTTGDIVQILNAHTVLSITAVTAGQTQSITVNGRTATATATTGVASDLAALVATTINNAPYLSNVIEAIAAGNDVYLISKDGDAYTIVKSGTATSTLSTPTTVPNNTPIGTVTTVDNAGVIYLAANAGLAVPVGVRIGCPVKQVLGLDVHSRDFVTAPTRDIALCTVSIGVETRYLPYIDNDIVKTLNQMKFDNRW